jgi:hypothetical protein
LGSCCDEFIRQHTAIGNHLYDYSKPAFAGLRKADTGRLWVLVAANFIRQYTAIGNRLHDHPKPACAGLRKADIGRLWVFVAANLFGNTRRLEIACTTIRNLPSQVRAKPTSVGFGFLSRRIHSATSGD